MTGLQLTAEVVVRITDTPGVEALDVFGPRIDFLSWSEVGGWRASRAFVAHW